MSLVVLMLFVAVMKMLSVWSKAAFTRDFGTVLYGTVPRRYG